MKNFTCRCFTVFIAGILTLNSFSQQGNNDKHHHRCGTVLAMEDAFKKDPSAKAKYEQDSRRLQFAYEESLKRKGVKNGYRQQDIITVPVIFHVVLPNPGALPDSVILKQLKVLNDDYAGLNADSVKIPEQPQFPNNFKSRFGKSNIQFCLAKSDPNGEPTTGIRRISSAISSGINVGDPIKYSALGGDDTWDPDKYLNIWIGVIPQGILGYATLAGQAIFPRSEQGVVLLYTSLPGGRAPYGLGRTATHEVGHYFWLRHIWGDDDGTCNGSDFPETPVLDDTPNQQDATGGCPTGVRVDGCAPFPLGYMYQNYMDYTDDACLVMFTKGQVERMNLAINTLRPGLLTSDACIPPVVYDRNIWMKKILFPVTQICKEDFKPIIFIRNKGTDTLRSATFTAIVDGGTPVITNWTGKINPFTDATIILNNIRTSAGNHNIKIYSSNPNAQPDLFPANDTATVDQFNLGQLISTSLFEGFENTSFPPAGWLLDNPDGGITWNRTTDAGLGSNNSMIIGNYNYTKIGQVDKITSPVFEVSGADSTFVSFDVAASTYSYPGSVGNNYDTLEVLVSGDCGFTYQSAYKKWGQSLTTVNKNLGQIDEFFPSSKKEWRHEKVYLTSLAGNTDNIKIAFKNTTAFENNVFIDNVNIYNVKLSPVLKEQGLLISPNPFADRFSVQHYPNSNTLKEIDIYNSLGQIMDKRTFTVGTGANFVSFNLGNAQAGIYYVKLIYTDRTVTRKIMKRN